LKAPSQTTTLKEIELRVPAAPLTFRLSVVWDFCDRIYCLASAHAICFGFCEAENAEKSMKFSDTLRKNSLRTFPETGRVGSTFPCFYGDPSSAYDDPCCDFST
jgi:hypothetical protein